MDDKACGETVVVTVPAAAPGAQPQKHDPARRMKLLRLAYAFGHCVRLAVLGVVAYSLVRAAHLATSSSPRRCRDLALLAAGYAVLAALVLLWLRRARRLKLVDYGPGGDERRWAKKAARDVLVDLVVLVFFFRVAELVPPPVSALVWCVMAIFACACVYIVAFCDNQYWRDRVLGNVGSGDAAGGDSKAAEMIRSADEKV